MPRLDSATGWLRGLLRAGTDELGWDDLVHRIVDAIAPLAHYGPRGEPVFPAVLRVEVTVPEARADVVGRFVSDPHFDRAVGDMLANRCDVAVDELPLRDYAAAAGAVARVEVTEGTPAPWGLRIEGGDLDGHALTLPPGTELGFGRGEWHGGEPRVRNDVVVCEKTAFISRRAGRLFRTGAHLEVAALDQGDLLLVRRGSGEVLRPARTARGRAVVRSGDVIELADGAGAAVRLIAQRDGGR